ncbi:hypothetical protein EB001_03965 [bacterium]|nr:hypothetical protein [bacterium]
MSILSKNQLKTNISAELADNNAGLISAYDVRHNMEDIVDSINQVVASGDFDVSTPFTGSNVRAKIRNNNYGMFIAESGVNFPNGGGTQYVPYPGASNIVHNNLNGLTTGDPHTQYLPLTGSRVMADNLGLGSNWINASGSSDIVSSDNRGLQFQTLSSVAENVNVGSSTKFVFKTDNSTLATAKGVAKAWITFDASSPTPVVNNSYNINELQKLDTGKFKIVFSSGILKNNYYVAVGNSNSRSTANSAEDFDLNTVGMVIKEGDDAQELRSLTFCVNDGNEFVDAAVNDIVIFGLGANESSGVPPTVTVL